MADRIDANRWLQPGDTFRSPNNRYRLSFQDDGNFVLYDDSDGSAIWASNTYAEDGNIQGRTIGVQSDGNVVMYQGENNAIWATSSNYDAQSPYLKLQDDGNLVLYDDNVEGAFWASGTSEGDRGL